MIKSFAIRMPARRSSISRPSISRCAGRRQGRQAFTLVELLVVVAIIGVLIAVLLPAIQGVRASARRMQCSNRMRQVGIGMQAYAEAHKGRLPKVTGHGETIEASWLTDLGPYLEYAEVVQICPSDPEADFRLENGLTSYVLNGFLAEIKDDHEDHEDGDHDDHEESAEHDDEHLHGGHDHEHFDGRFSNIGKLKSTSTTIMLFEAAVQAHIDHVDAFEWFVDEQIDADTVYQAITSEVAVDRHAGDQANYLFADNHIEVIDAEQIRRWSREGTDHDNFVRPRD